MVAVVCGGGFVGFFRAPDILLCISLSLWQLECLENLA